jgi:cytidylate kinase
MIITIDGPAGSGKSSTAKALARKINFKYLDTGAMYRALTFKLLKRNVDPRDIRSLNNILEDTRIDLVSNHDGLRVILDGEDVTDLIRSQEINEMVSDVSVIKEVRDFLVPRQRRFAEGNDVIAEGRDIGTVVFPDAELKIFMIASLDQRSRRRLLEENERGNNSDMKTVQSVLEKRDFIDSHRDVSPLKKADDAVVIDTSDLSFDEQVDMIVDLYNKLRDTRNKK